MIFNGREIKGLVHRGVSIDLLDYDELKAAFIDLCEQYELLQQELKKVNFEKIEYMNHCIKLKYPVLS